VTSPIVAVFMIMAAVVLYALNRKGRVRADFKCFGTAFSLEVEDKPETIVRGVKVIPPEH
jgi:hypothetical protein